jgi:hypothetical protein
MTKFLNIPFFELSTVANKIIYSKINSRKSKKFKKFFCNKKVGAVDWSTIKLTLSFFSQILKI